MEVHQVRMSEVDCPHETWARQRLEAQEVGDYELSAQILDLIAASPCPTRDGMLVQLRCLMDLLDHHHREGDCPVRRILESLDTGLRSLTGD